MIQVARLEDSLKKLGHCDLKNEYMKSAAERLMQIAIEEVMNIGNHIISGNGLRKAESYRDIFKVLAEHKIISVKMSDELQQFAVFRNRMVHLYWKISDEEFKIQFTKVKILRDFVKKVVRYSVMR